MAKRILGVLLVVSIALGLAACVWSAEGDMRAKALDSVKEPLQLMDERISAYEGALRAVYEYTENQTVAGLAETKAIVAKAIADIVELPEAKLYLNDRELEAFADIGVDTEGFRSLFDYQALNKSENIKTLLRLSYYLDAAPEDNEFLGYLTLFYIDTQNANRKLEFFNLNKLFCGFSGTEIAGFRENFLPKLTALCADGLPWETDESAISDSIGAAMDGVAEALSSYAPALGERLMEALNAGANAEEVLLGGGFDPAEAERLSQMIDELSERALTAG